MGRKRKSSNNNQQNQSSTNPMQVIDKLNEKYRGKVIPKKTLASACSSLISFLRKNNKSETIGKMKKLIMALKYINRHKIPIRTFIISQMKATIKRGK